jgi:hypothetical protein
MEHTTDIPGRLRWLGVAVAAAATLGVGTMVAAHDNVDTVAVPHTVTVAGSSPTDPYESCLQSGSPSADRIAERAAECRQRTDELYADPAFIDCLRHAVYTPDALEHWLERCRILTQR